MSLLSALIVVLIILVALDLTLTAAVIRKLRVHEERLAGDTFDPRPAVAIGHRLPEFSVATTAGSTRSDSDLLGRYTVLVFASTTCASCRSALPVVSRYLAGAMAQGAQAWTVVAGNPDAVAEMGADLPDGTVLINEGVGGPLHGAVRLQAYPGYVLVAPDGTVEAVARGIDELPDVLTGGLVGTAGAQ